MLPIHLTAYLYLGDLMEKILPEMLDSEKEGLNDTSSHTLTNGVKINNQETKLPLSARSNYSRYSHKSYKKKNVWYTVDQFQKNPPNVDALTSIPFEERRLGNGIKRWLSDWNLFFDTYKLVTSIYTMVVFFAALFSYSTYSVLQACGQPYVLCMCGLLVGPQFVFNILFFYKEQQISSKVDTILNACHVICARHFSHENQRERLYDEDKKTQWGLYI